MTSRIALLVFGSGLCALVYQTAWFRMLRLVFGVSTSASAAALAIFMGGLGLGGALLGRRGDRSPSPLRLYGNLELGVAAFAAVSPFVMALVNELYIMSGGSERLGMTTATVLRLALAAVVLGGPTVLMGGTLPAIAAAASTPGDRGRRGLAWMYGANTMGAVAGALLATFFGFEWFGVRRTLWIACLLNLAIGIVARALAREQSEREVRSPPAVEPALPVAEPGAASEGAPRGFVFAAAAAVGLAFFVMELAWYRLFAPLLGGSSYTFGLILAMALLGIGLGGLAYGLGRGERRPTLADFALVSALEAVMVALPFALGDRLAILTMLLRSLAALGFAGLSASWVVITAIVVLPPALIAGYQFPMLVGLLGSGQRNVGREVGLAYAWNTLGAIAGALLGGFGLMPLVGATGVWRGTALLLSGVALVTLVLAVLRERRWPRALAALSVATVAILLVTLATGPTAAWRHSPIGAGRVSLPEGDGNGVSRFLNERRGPVVWGVDGIESTVALWIGQAQGYSLIVNGKSDGSCRADASTQVMGGLIGAVLHPAPRTAVVIGLGTGSTVGWLADVATMERVDSVELEPAVLRVAEACASVNRGVLTNPRVRHIIGDGREFVRTTSETYDIIFSEPSNPYRAGVASLFSREFYEAAKLRLSEGGIFLQWLQSYEVDAKTMRTAFATLASVFDAVETYEISTGGDLVFAATREPLVHDLARVRDRVLDPAIAAALRLSWGVDGVDGFYTSFVAGPAFARAVRDVEGTRLNTDDRPLLEYGFARGVGRHGTSFSTQTLRDLARERGEDLPNVARGETALDANRLAELLVARRVYEDGNDSGLVADLDEAGLARVLARRSYRNGDLVTALSAWRSQSGEPACHLDRLLLAESLAFAGDPGFEASARELARDSELEAAIASVAWYRVRGDAASAATTALAVMAKLAEDPWPFPSLLTRLYRQVPALALADPSRAAALLEAMVSPKTLELQRDDRMRAGWALAQQNFPVLCASALAPTEPYVIWEEGVLRGRADCYRRRNHPLADRADRELRAFLAAAPESF